MISNRKKLTVITGGRGRARELRREAELERLEASGVSLRKLACMAQLLEHFDDVASELLGEIEGCTEAELDALELYAPKSVCDANITMYELEAEMTKAFIPGEIEPGVPR